MKIFDRLTALIIFYTSFLWEKGRCAFSPSATLPAQGCIHTVHWIQISYHQMKCSDHRHRYCKPHRIHLCYTQTSAHCNNCGDKMESVCYWMKLLQQLEPLFRISSFWNYLEHFIIQLNGENRQDKYWQRLHRYTIKVLYEPGVAVHCDGLSRHVCLAIVHTWTTCFINAASFSIRQQAFRTHAAWYTVCVYL